jgi:hypothetical protein
MPKDTQNAGAGDAGAPFSLPADLSTLTVEQLDELAIKAREAFTAIVDVEGGPTAEQYAQAEELVTALESVEGRKGEVAAEAADNAAKFDALRQRATPPEPVAAEGEAPVEGETPAEATTPEGAPAPQLVTASSQRPAGGVVTASRDTGGLRGPSHRVNPSLSGAKSNGPAQVAPEQRLAITASVGLPGQFEMGSEIPSIRGLGDLMEARAKNMPNQGMIPSAQQRRRRHDDPYGGVQVASIRNDFATKFNDSSSVDVVQEYIDKINSDRGIGNFASLVAAGGWCAPSQIRYDFFNIARECGMIDLPTFGVERGGINFPVSPSLADTFVSPALAWYTAFSNATVPWLWTEGDDILAVTGSPTKPCIRVPCSTMSDRRLECYGICLTAGNLADNAWPESTRNFLALLMSAHYHASNGRYISTISSLATQVASCSASGQGAAAPILSTAELGAIDYRAKYGMCGTDVMEAVYPEWALGLIRADLAKRTGVSDFMRIPDSEIAAWFDVRGIRAQFVQDYQVRAAGQPGASTAITAYPSTVKNFLYAAGTVARGNGMTLDLGVVRDSTLNARNDFTAAWMEECHLIARFGHEVREYTTNACADGTTGAADLTACCP